LLLFRVNATSFAKAMGEVIKRWTARRKSALVLEIIHGETTVAQASRQFDLRPAKIEGWVAQSLSLPRRFACSGNSAAATLTASNNRARPTPSRARTYIP
jgi:transposase-like protein